MEAEPRGLLQHVGPELPLRNHLVSGLLWTSLRVLCPPFLHPQLLSRFIMLNNDTVMFFFFYSSVLSVSPRCSVRVWTGLFSLLPQWLGGYIWRLCCIVSVWELDNGSLITALLYCCLSQSSFPSFGLIQVQKQQERVWEPTFISSQLTGGVTGVIVLKLACLLKVNSILLLQHLNSHFVICLPLAISGQM